MQQGFELSDPLTCPWNEKGLSSVPLVHARLCDDCWFSFRRFLCDHRDSRELRVKPWSLKSPDPKVDGWVHYEIAAARSYSSSVDSEWYEGGLRPRLGFVFLALLIHRPSRHSRLFVFRFPHSYRGGAARQCGWGGQRRCGGALRPLPPASWITPL